MTSRDTMLLVLLIKLHHLTCTMPYCILQILINREAVTPPAHISGGFDVSLLGTVLYAVSDDCFSSLVSSLLFSSLLSIPLMVIRIESAIITITMYLTFYL